MDPHNNGRKPVTYINPDAGLSNGVIFGMAVAVVVAAGAVWYAVKMPMISMAPFVTDPTTVVAPFMKAISPAPVTAPAPQALPMPTP